MESVKDFIVTVVLGIVALGVAIGLIVGGIAGFSAFGRSQDRADASNNAKIALVKANNNVQVTQIEIQNQEQQIQVTKQQAEIRYQEAVGIRKAQDEVSKTLTPLYVQMEYAKALEQIATSGKNNSVIYIPTGPGGVPIVTNSSPAPTAGQ